ncbi:hypothetical protein L6164_014974 [Bauhinia variegata]|uniref:Uncharacterized protein n=1 Tax=Bauhinia variegata TaxID=167791 RepID=A0ACB9NJ89_BAUVA|nr:hypothetical protein L6164_014974 [Bauhinia variegata]
MKNKASAFLKHVVSVLSSILKAKTMGIKSKTNAVKARLIVLSLMKNKKVLVDSLSHKIQSVLGQGSKDYLDDVGVEQSKAIVLYEGHYNEEPSEIGYCNYEGDDGDDDDKYPDLRHSLFDEEDLDLDEDLEGGCGSIIDMMRNSKQEEGQDFSLEDEIDHVADLFITKFRKQIRLQKLQSFKRFQEMMARSV